ncbi:MAG: proton-conducting transporter membrane subunit [Hyphomonadaceae bacterium]
MSEWLDHARTYAPLLIVAAPLACAAVAGALAPGRTAWAAACAVLAACAWLAWDMGQRTLLGGATQATSIQMLALRADGVGLFAAPMVLLAGALTIFAAGARLKQDYDKRVAPFAVALGLIVSAGWAGALLAPDLFTLAIAAQLGWLAGAGLIALRGGGDGLTGAFRMLVVGGVATALMLIGAALIARGAGGGDLHALSAAAASAGPGLAAGVGFVLIGLAAMAGVAPLHAWVGPAFTRAGAVAAMVLGVVGACGALLLLVRVAAFASAAPAIANGVSTALLALGLISVVIGSAQAIGARNLRRLAAYAGVAQAGYILVSASLGSPAGFAAALVQILAFGVSAMALLAGASVIGGNGALDALDGLARRAPLTSAAMLAGVLNLMGAPLTLGFLGRWRLIEAGVGSGWWWSAGAVIAASLAAVFYGGRLIERIYFRRASQPGNERRLWNIVVAPALVAAIAGVALGLGPGNLLRAADAAAAQAMAGGEP